MADKGQGEIRIFELSDHSLSAHSALPQHNQWLCLRSYFHYKKTKRCENDACHIEHNIIKVFSIFKI